MREIKFRIWDMDRKIMLGSQGIIFYYGDFYENYRDLEDGIVLDNIAVMQYTEQVDKQDKQIYEKDIIKFKLSDGYDYVDDIGIVDFYKEGGEYAIFINGDPWCNLANAKDIEIIGNIYQNKFLLEG